MADVRCPMCGKPNPEELEQCQYCGARLKPIIPSSPVDSQPIKLGQEPVKQDNSEFEKARFTGEGPIHPGEAPTKKDTGELEQALPSWLRSLREGKRPAAGESLAEPSSDESLPAASQADSSGLPDWLSGLGKAGSDDDEVPDWLAGLRGDKTSESTPVPKGVEEEAAELENDDWMSRLGSEPPKPKPDPADTAKLPPLELPSFEASPEPAPQVNLPDWLQNLQPSGPDAQESPVPSQGGEHMPDWLSGLADIPSENPPALIGTEEPAPLESTPDLLDRLNQKPVETEPGAPVEGGESVPDWLSSVGSIPAAPGPAVSDNIPEWLSNVESKSGPESGTPPALFGNEPLAASIPPEETPDWLSQLQAEANALVEGGKDKGDFEVASEPPVFPGSAGPLPDWLAEINHPTPPGDTPALIVDNQAVLPGGEGEPALPVEAPDWLSNLNPGHGAEKAPENKNSQPDSERIETAELPSWVQAMRPVESVVDTKATTLDENPITELSGPLAGLRGVLPASPGLGLLRKPPAYSTKLQVSDGQHRYATSLEQLVAGEAQPRPLKTARPASNRLWRWLIAIILILAAGLPFASSVQFAPPTLLLSSDKGASSKIIEGLSANIPVLVAFDYDPALSGELEAVAAPVMDQLLARGTPLALISTSPTGPALAEHFLQNTPLVNMYKYQSGAQYVNLGYVAGGPAGMLYLANALTVAIPLSVEGKSAWNAGPLQGIQSVNNFGAVIILTDNANTGRDWIEQVGPGLGNTPMLMVISAQAEPMIRPYFDSGQLKGLVSGLADAKIYEQPHNRTGLAYHYWNSFSVGMLVAELLIGIGVILGVMADRRTPRKDSRGEA